MPRSRNDATAKETRERLVAAAVTVFSERGYDATRLADVARLAGVTTGAIYVHFRDKAELLLAAIAHGTRRALDEAAERHRAGAGPRDQLDAMGRRLADAHGEPLRRLLLEAFAASKRDPHVAAHLHETIAAEADALRAMVRQGQRGGELDPEVDVEALVRLAQALSFGFMFMDAVGEAPIEGRAWADVVARLVGGWAPDGAVSVRTRSRRGTR